MERSINKLIALFIFLSVHCLTFERYEIISTSTLNLKSKLNQSNIRAWASMVHHDSTFSDCLLLTEHLDHYFVVRKKSHQHINRSKLRLNQYKSPGIDFFCETQQSGGEKESLIMGNKTMSKLFSFKNHE